MTRTLDRRHFLTTGVAAGSALLVAGRAAACTLNTPAQTEGPFYPVDPQDDTDWDLTRVAGLAGAPLGEQIYVTGTVTDGSCNPVAGVLVEIWQACASGRYDHPGDTSGLALDPNFQYWGQVLTGADGTYKFKTIIPGDYPADVNWQRPPHIHFKAHKRGYRELTTQMYFAGHPLNAKDLILQDLSADEQAKVVVALTGDGAGLRTATFDLGIRKV